MDTGKSGKPAKRSESTDFNYYQDLDHRIEKLLEELRAGRVGSTTSSAGSAANLPQKSKPVPREGTDGKSIGK